MSPRTACLVAGLLLLTAVAGGIRLIMSPDGPASSPSGSTARHPEAGGPTLESAGREETGAEGRPVPDEAPPTTRSLRGRVILAHGAPAAGILVMQSGWPFMDGARTRTDTAGRFKLTGVPLGEFKIHAEGVEEGQEDLQGMYLVRAGESDVQLVLHDLSSEWSAFSFRVRGPDGEIVTACRWEVRCVDELRSSDEMEEPCDRLGWARLPADDRGVGGQLWIDVWDARGRDERRLDAGALRAGPFVPSDRPVLFLPAEKPVSGRVLGLDGTPVAGARIVVRRWLGSPLHAFHDDVLAEAYSSKTGAFRVGGVGTVAAWLETSGPAGFASSLPFEVRGGESDLTIVLPTAPPARILVEDVDGSPLTGVRVEAIDTRLPSPGIWAGSYPRYTPQPQAVAAETTDAGGVAVFNGLDPRETYTLVVNPDLPLSERTHEEVWRERWRVHDTTVILRRLASIAGRVTDGAGVGIRDVNVEAVLPGGEVMEAISDADGYFTVTGVLEGAATLTAILRRGKANELRSPSLRTKTGANDIVLRLE